MEKDKKKSILFLDLDGTICLSNNWGGREKKWKKHKKLNPETINDKTAPIDVRFDDFDKKAIKVLNQVLEETGAEIVLSSDWKLHATLEEIGDYFLSQGVIKKPIAYTPNLNECTNYDDTFPWNHQWGLEQCRSIEIKQYLLNHPEVTHWVAVDDLNMGKNEPFKESWGLDNFVLTPLSREGIKQSGIKEKIIKYLTNE